MTPLQKILAAYRGTSQTEREKGTYFEELIRTYPLELFLRVVTVSLETNRIVAGLPKLEI